MHDGQGTPGHCADEGRRRLLQLALALPAAAAMRGARAETPFPARTVRYVVPYAAGGPADQVGRLVAQGLTARWPQPVEVENRPGANANISAELVARAAPDGHVLLQGTSSTHGSNPALYGNLGYDAEQDFEPVAGLIEAPVYLVVRGDSRWRTVDALLRQARDKPGSVRYGTAGPGSPQHVAGELLRLKAQAPLTAVHYRGAVPALYAMERGDIELYFDSRAPAMRAPGLLTLAVSTRGRWPLAPDIPTLAECGVPDFELRGWFGLFAPARTPAAVVDRIHRGVAATLAQPAVRSEIERMGLRVLGESPAGLKARVRRELASWRELVRANRITLD